MPVDYAALFESATLVSDPGKLKELDYITRVMLTNLSIYGAVGSAVRIPWALIAAIHYREADQCFKRHLHNGDPLTDRTVHVPAGRPRAGQPPFSWQESAIDALTGIWTPETWSLPSCLEFLERYNGTGYQKHGVNTPYLWDYTSAYSSGLYVADGSFDPTARESRPGCVALLKTLKSKGVSLDFSSVVSTRSLLH